MKSFSLPKGIVLFPCNFRPSLLPVEHFRTICVDNESIDWLQVCTYLLAVSTVTTDLITEVDHLVQSKGIPMVSSDQWSLGPFPFTRLILCAFFTLQCDLVTCPLVHFCQCSMSKRAHSAAVNVDPTALAVSLGITLLMLYCAASDVVFDILPSKTSTAYLNIGMRIASSIYTEGTRTPATSHGVSEPSASLSLDDMFRKV